MEQSAGDRVWQGDGKLGGAGKMSRVYAPIDYRPGRTRVKQLVWPLADR